MVRDAWLYSDGLSLAVCLRCSVEGYVLVVDIPWDTIRDAMAAQKTQRKKVRR